MIGPIIRVMILRINLVQTYSSKFGNSQRSLLSPTGVVNSISPIQQNSLKNGYDENNNYQKDDENKCEINLQHHHKQQVEREHAQQHAAHQARHQ